MKLHHFILFSFCQFTDTETEEFLWHHKMKVLKIETLTEARVVFSKIFLSDCIISVFIAKLPLRMVFTNAWSSSAKSDDFKLSNAVLLHNIAGFYAYRNTQINKQISKRICIETVTFWNYLTQLTLINYLRYSTEVSNVSFFNYIHMICNK